jgi:hypothetical protein
MLLDGEAEILARKAVEMALSGDPAALRMCLDRTDATDFERRLRKKCGPSNRAIPLTTPNDRPSQTKRCTGKPPFNFCRISSDM